MTSSRPRLVGIEWVALTLAIAASYGFYLRGVAYPSDYDAKLYVEIAADIGEHGLFSNYHYAKLRTYGYPLFLLLVRHAGDALRIPWDLAIVAAQLAGYLGAALFVRAQLCRVSPAVARMFFVATALNVVALTYVAETLAESMSLTLLLLAAGCWLYLFAGGRRIWLALFAGGLAIGAAIAVRPSNVFALPAMAVSLLAVAWLLRWTALRAGSALLVAAAALALPLAPQLANNVRHFDEWTPLVATSLGRFQQVWGIAYIKYATALAPIPLPSVFYRNPFADGRPVDEMRPLRWYAEHPIAGAATLGLHVFGMLDQDLLFTYARDLDPWYRRPLGIATHGAVALALLALAWLGVRAWREGDRRTRAVFVVLSTLVACHVALHATTAVEMRFGLPLLVLAVPLAAWFVRERCQRAGLTGRLLVAAFVAAWIAGSLLLSDWMRAQAAPIREWQARYGAPR